MQFEDLNKYKTIELYLLLLQCLAIDEVERRSMTDTTF